MILLRVVVYGRVIEYLIIEILYVIIVTAGSVHIHDERFYSIHLTVFLLIIIRSLIADIGMFIPKMWPYRVL